MVYITWGLGMRQVQLRGTRDETSAPLRFPCAFVPCRENMLKIDSRQALPVNLYGCGKESHRVAVIHGGWIRPLFHENMFSRITECNNRPVEPAEHVVSGTLSAFTNSGTAYPSVFPACIRVVQSEYPGMKTLPVKSWMNFCKG